MILYCPNCENDFTNTTFITFEISDLTAKQILDEEYVISDKKPVSEILKIGDLCPICLAGVIQDTKREEVTQTVNPNTKHFVIEWQ